jgi:HNH endonuclease
MVGMGMNCLVCDSEITDANDTEEHLVPRAIGGRRTVRRFICKGCNDSSGATWEAEIARQLQSLSLLFATNRQKGKTPSLKVITSKDEALTISDEGLSLSAPKIIRAPDGTAVQIVARNEAEARDILQGLKRKHASIDVEAELAKGQLKEDYAKGFVKHNLTFAGPSAGRSIVKSCLALAHSQRFNWTMC